MANLLSQPGADEREFLAEELESRTLFSGAPVEAPHEVPASPEADTVHEVVIESASQRVADIQSGGGFEGIDSFLQSAAQEVSIEQIRENLSEVSFGAVSLGDGYFSVGAFATLQDDTEVGITHAFDEIVSFDLSQSGPSEIEYVGNGVFRSLGHHEDSQGTIQFSYQTAGGESKSFNLLLSIEAVENARDNYLVTAEEVMNTLGREVGGVEAGSNQRIENFIIYVNGNRYEENDPKIRIIEKTAIHLQIFADYGEGYVVEDITDEIRVNSYGGRNSGNVSALDTEARDVRRGENKQNLSPYYRGDDGKLVQLPWIRFSVANHEEQFGGDLDYRPYGSGNGSVNNTILNRDGSVQSGDIVDSGRSRNSNEPSVLPIGSDSGRLMVLGVRFDALEDAQLISEHTAKAFETLHYIRNLFNDPDDALSNGEEASDIGSRYHTQGGKIDNRKFVNGGNEAVIDGDGNLDTSPLNGGTFNYSNGVGHLPLDMVPYWIWGNSPDDPTAWHERILGTYSK